MNALVLQLNQCENRLYDKQTEADPNKSPERKSARRGVALTKEAMKECHWLRPELVAEIEFVDWTEQDHLRHSKFVELRDDKDAREVEKEVA